MLSKQNAFDTVVNHRTNEYKDTVLASKLQAKYAEKPLYKRLEGAKLAVLIFSYLANMASFLTCLVFITYFLFKSLEPYFGAKFALVCSGLIALGVSSIIEKLKRTSSNSFFIGIFRYSRFSILAFCSLLFLTSVSFFLSLYGGQIIPKISSPEIAYIEPKLDNIQDIRQQYDADILQIRKDKESFFERNHYKGRLSTEKGLIYANFDTRISELQKASDKAVNAAKESNKDLLKQSKANHESKLEQQQSSINSQSTSIGFLVLGFEACFILSMCFIHWLDFKTYVLFLSMGWIEPEKINVVNHGSSDGTGEHGADTTTTNEPQPTSQTDVTNSPNQVITKTNGSKPYILIEGYKDQVFTLSRINNFISSYQNKLNKWNIRNSEGTANEEQKKNILNNLSKWSNYAQQLRNLSTQKTQ